jgi:HEAT repeat protein
MRKRLAILLTALLGVVIAGVVVSHLRDREPRFQGKPLSYWFREYARYGAYAYPGQQGEARGDQALKALRAIGTNAVPFLVAECLSTNQDSPLTTNLATALSKVGFAAYVPKEQMGTAAYEALRELKPPAWVLLPYLTSALAETNSPRRLYALYVLNATGEGAEATVPYLAAALRGANPREQTAAVISAGRLGAPAKGAIPDLIELLSDVNLRRAPSRLWVADTLGGFGTNAASATPVLLDMLAGSDSREWRAAAEALYKIGGDRRSLAAALVKKLDDSLDADHFSVVTLILRLEPTNATALSALIEIAKAEPSLRRQAFQELGKLGAAARPAIPMLREATTNIYTLREVARTALENIESALATNSSAAK